MKKTLIAKKAQESQPLCHAQSMFVEVVEETRRDKLFKIFQALADSPEIFVNPILVSEVIKWSPPPHLPVCRPAPRFAFAQRDGYLSPTEDRADYVKIDDESFLYVVMDGHAGHTVVNYVLEHLPPLITSTLRALKVQRFERHLTESQFLLELCEIMRQSFLTVDQQLLQSETYSRGKGGGCSCTVALTLPDHIVVAHVGDSPCFSFSKSDMTMMTNCTVIHDPLNPNEVERIKEAGGRISCAFDGSPRVDGPHLGMTRAFGHKAFKHVIVADPDVKIWKREKDTMLVLCSDSFTEKIVTSRDDVTGKTVSRIRNMLSSADILHQVSVELETQAFDLDKTVEALVQHQVNKFEYNGRFCGDNTTMLIVDLSF